MLFIGGKYLQPYTPQLWGSTTRLDVYLVAKIKMSTMRMNAQIRLWEKC